LKKYIIHTGTDLIIEGLGHLTTEVNLINVRLTGFRRYFRAIHYKLRLPFFKFWGKFYFKHIEDNSLIIVFDSSFVRNNLELLRKTMPNSKIIFWYWNTVSNDKYLNLIRSNCSNIYSFDKLDCENYNLKFIPQFYWDYKNLKSKKEIDILFVGQVKNRISMIENLYKEFLKQGLNVFFYVTKSNSNDNSAHIELQEKSIKYGEVVQLISKSKCILDLTKDGQTGLSLRPVEALFFQIKLITNNSHITDYDFFNENNICIINNKKQDFKSFLNLKSKKIPQTIIDKYHINNWLNRIISNESF